MSSTRYSNYTFVINESGEYEVDLFLKYGIETDSYEMKEGKEEFTIIEFTKNKIILKNEKFDYEMKLLLER